MKPPSITEPRIPEPKECNYCKQLFTPTEVWFDYELFASKAERVADPDGRSRSGWACSGNHEHAEGWELVDEWDARHPPSLYKAAPAMEDALALLADLVGGMNVDGIEGTTTIGGQYATTVVSALEAARVALEAAAPEPTPRVTATRKGATEPGA